MEYFLLRQWFSIEDDFFYEQNGYIFVVTTERCYCYLVGGEQRY